VSDPYLGEIRMVSFNFPPKGWAFCNGQLLPISQNQALFSLLGTTYGGDGRVTFALPNLQGRMPVHVSPTDPLGTQGGAEAVTLGITELPTHTHVVVADAGVATATTPAGNLLAKKPRFGADVYAAPADLTALAGGAVSTAGGSQAHTNLQPFLALSFVIALQGIFPSRS
jgi:microcystin-dependent protein